jgi:uncharacterized protein GlcG (DUF336 family)
VIAQRPGTAAWRCGALAALLVATTAPADTLVTFKMLDPDVALEMAQAALDSCRAKSFQVTVAVVDRMGVPQVVLRDRFAGAHTPESATRKAATAVSFRSDTLTLAGSTNSDSPHSGARFIDGILMLGGGVPVTAAGSTVAGIGVAGAPSSADDHACAQAGIAAVIERLELAE